ncbi:MAG: pilus assembly protein MshD [Gammaproteobacteria bacterium]|nr:MAG: pilus assembly protein MshD [Gammaproteobacteria bacterium]
MAGVTLVEMVMYIAIVSIGVAGILSVMTYTTRYSADPMVEQQALLIAESYMEEILHKRFTDPTAGATQVCPTALPYKEASRASYDNVCDYDNLNDSAGAVDQLGNTIAGLTAYNVSVSVTGNVGDALALGPTASQITNVGALRVLRVNVEVTHDDIPDFRLLLTGYRTNYYCDTTETTVPQGCLPR